MTFRIRQIDFTAGGREIVRDRMLDKTRLTVGRAAENDLHLPDLAVEAYHAQMVTPPGGFLEVASTGTLGFTRDGSTTNATSIEIATGGELGFGGYRITVSKDSDGATLLVVRQVASTADATSDFDEKRSFTLASVLPGKRGLSWALASIILLAFLLVPVIGHQIYGSNPKAKITGDASWDPGALSLGHAKLQDNCQACHVKAFVSVRDETCTSCHKDTHDHGQPGRIATARDMPGLGGNILWGVAHAFGKTGPGACVDCHVEHQGARHMDPPAQKFCADCHGSLKERLADTKLGDASDFGTAHPELKVQVSANPWTKAVQRLPLSDHPRENSGLAFPHKAHLDPLGGVARMAMRLGQGAGYGQALTCTNCHHETEDRVRFKPVNMEKDCAACHSLGYDRLGTTVRTLHHGDVAQVIADLRTAGPAATPLGNRRRPGNYDEGRVYYSNFAPPVPVDPVQRAFSKEGVCGECHAPVVSGGRIAITPVRLTQRYMLHGWFDHKSHDKEKCSSCHAAAQSTTSTDVLLPDLKQCRTCHLGESASRPKVASSCAMCHDYHVSPGAPRGAKVAKK